MRKSTAGVTIFLGTTEWRTSESRAELRLNLDEDSLFSHLSAPFVSRKAIRGSAAIRRAERKPRAPKIA
jgi:hypothetical protein